MASSQASRAASGVVADIGAGRYPRPLIVAVVSWVLLAVILLFSWVGAPQASDQNRDTASAIDQLNDIQVRAPTGQDTWWFPYLWVVGVLVLVAAVLLALGQGWTRILLALFGVVAIAALATGGLWTVYPAIALVILGSVCGLLVSSHRYLSRRGSSTPTAEEPKARTTP